MQSDNFDKKIKDSLSQRPPGNDNPAWDKMETLLDKHMPVEKKDRRRIFFILFGFLLLGGGAFLTWQTNTGNKREITSTNSQKQNADTTDNNNQPKTDKNIPSSIVPESGQTKTEGSKEIRRPNLFDPLAGDEIKINAAGKIVRQNKNANNTIVKNQ